MEIGWRLMDQEAPFERDYLLSSRPLTPLARVLLRSLHFTSFAFKMAMKFVSKEPVTALDLASAPELEPALESLLRSLKAHDSVIE